MKSLHLAAVAAVSASALFLTACGSGSSAQSSGSASAAGSDFTVVTSTNVYSDIVSQVAGDKVKIEPIIDDPAKDPHDYEATSADQLKVKDAKLVVQNGGGYDAFMTTMLKATGTNPDVIDAVKISGLPGADEAAGESDEHASEESSEEGHEHGEEGHEHSHGEFNEHVWYSIPTMVKVVDAVESKLAEKLPDSPADFQKNADSYKEQLKGLETKESDVKKKHDGQKVAATEPVPLWMFGDMGLTNATPDEFLEAVEEGNDVPPLVLKKAKDQIQKKQVKLLAYNTQASNDQANDLAKTAKSSGVPVVDVSETKPSDSSYIQWMTSNIDNITKALG